MASPFAGFSIIDSALNAMQQAVDVAGQNIANATTPGYANETVSLSTMPSVVQGSLGGPTGADALGTGVQVQAVKRQTEAFLTQGVRTAQSVETYGTQVVNVLTQAQDLLSEPSSSGLAAIMEQMFTDLATLAQNPQSTAARAVVVQDAQNVVAQFHTLATGLTGISTNLEQDLQSQVTTANNLIGQIADLNQQITTAQVEGSQPNSLIDQRSNLLNQLSKQMAITVGADSQGNLTVTDSATGVVLIDGSEAGNLTVANDATGAPVLVSEVAAGSPSSATPTAAAITSGNIGADLGLLSGALAPPGSASAGNSMLSGLNQVASALATSMNALQANGYYLDPNTGSPVQASTGSPSSPTTDPAVTTFFTEGSGSTGSSAAAITAAGIALNQDIAQNGSFIAAASSANAGDGSNAQAMGDLGQSTNPSSAVQLYAGQVSSIGTEVAGDQSQLTTAQSLLTQAQTTQESVSGVDINQAVTDLSQYEEVYTAAAKAMGSMQNMLASLMAAVS